MAWHAGWPLVPTVFTSRHLLTLNSLTDEPENAAHHNSLLYRILVPYLEAYNVSLGYAWQELARGAVFEGEDWMGDMAGREEWDVEALDLGDLEEVGEVLEGLEIGESRRIRGYCQLEKPTVPLGRRRQIWNYGGTEFSGHAQHRDWVADIQMENLWGCTAKGCRRVHNVSMRVDRLVTP